GSARYDSIGIDQQLSCAGDECCIVGFSTLREASVKGDKCLVPSEGSRERCGVERAPQALPASCNVPLALVIAAVIVEGRKAGEGCGLLPTEAPELGHADDERQCGTLTDAGHAEHQI